MSNYFVFTPDSGSAIDSSSYNVLLSGLGTYGAPERDVTAVSIPGRNGDLIFDNGRFFNAEVFYDCGMSRNFVDFDTFRSLLMLNSTTYGWLTDTYHPTEKRRARVARIEEISTTAANLGGRFRVVFDCKPQRYLASGEIPITLTNNTAASVVLNTPYAAYPLIEVTPTSQAYIYTIAVQNTITSGGTTDTLSMTVTWDGLVSALYGYDPGVPLLIDCELKNATYTKRTPNAFPNGVPGRITQTTATFPYLVPPNEGTNSFKVTITPYPGESAPCTIALKTREYIV